MNIILDFGKRCVKLVRNILSSCTFIILVILLAAVAILITLLVAVMCIVFFIVAPFLAFFGVGSEKLEELANAVKAKAGKSATIHPFNKKD